jgi:hypothetical protein
VTKYLSKRKIEEERLIFDSLFQRFQFMLVGRAGIEKQITEAREGKGGREGERLRECLHFTLSPFSFIPSRPSAYGMVLPTFRVGVN